MLPPGALATLVDMTLKQRAVSLTLLLSSVLLGACGAPAHVSDQIEGCPATYRHIDVNLDVIGVNGAPIEGRPFTITVAGASYDPEYGGILVEGVGITGRNPYAMPERTDDAYNPVICIPDERAVAIMVRMSVQDPPAAYEIVQCELIDQGVFGTGQGNVLPMQERVALDQRQVELSDLAVRGGWVVAQCDYLHVPGGFTGQVPELFPRPVD